MMNTTERGAVVEGVVRLDAAARLVTVSKSFRDLAHAARPRTSYTPTLRPNAYAHGSDGERAVLRLRRGLHRFGVEVYPAFGSLCSERAR